MTRVELFESVIAVFAPIVKLQALEFPTRFNLNLS